MYFVFKSNYINYLKRGKQNDKKDKERNANKNQRTLETGLSRGGPSTLLLASGLSSVTVGGWGPPPAPLTPTRSTHCERWNTRLLCLRALPLSAQVGLAHLYRLGVWLPVLPACCLPLGLGSCRNACFLGTRLLPPGRCGIVRGVCRASGQQTVERLRFFHIRWETMVALSPLSIPPTSWPPTILALGTPHSP